MPLDNMSKKNVIYFFIFFPLFYIFSGCSSNSLNEDGFISEESSYYSESCGKNGNINTCYNLGVSYENGIGVVQDYNRAYFFYQKACNYRNMNACYNLGVLHYNAYGRAKNILKAKSFFLKSCQLGNSDGCNHYSMIENKERMMAEQKYEEEKYMKKKKRFFVHKEEKRIFLDGNESREVYNQDMNKQMIEKKFINIDKNGNYYESLYQKGY